MDPEHMDRRTFIATSTLTGAALLAGVTKVDAETEAVATGQESPVMKHAFLRVNGREYSLLLDTRRTLLDALREQRHLTGAKKGCDHGQCGACTIHIDGERHLSCLTLALAAQGHAITTIEGLATEGHLHPLQQAFIDHDAFQCGYCTSGQIMSGIACIREGHAETDADIREYMSGNLCRCAAYPNIVAAVRQARVTTEATR